MTSTKNTIVEDGVCPTLTARMGTGGNQVNAVLSSVGFDAYNQVMTGDVTKPLTSAATDSDHIPLALCGAFQETGIGWWNESNVGATLRAMSGGDAMKANLVGRRHIVRRLTPLECERLQGYPDGGTDIGEWVDSKGKKHKEADSPRYKALGNSIAIPPWKWVLKRLCACYERDATMASLFDGIGGFPYIWEQLNGKGSCLWASEIEEFPIAVTKLRFGG
jgi:DNA (cytosine-5)-methyltransferase 1